MSYPHQSGRSRVAESPAVYERKNKIGQKPCTSRMQKWQVAGMCLSQTSSKLTGVLKEFRDPMKLKFVCSIAAAVVLSVAAFAQASGSSAALPAAPGAADPAPTAPAYNPNAKVAALNVEGAIFATNEGQRDMGALQKKFETKFNDLKTKNDELEALNKQLSAAGTAQDKKEDITRQIDQKKKVFDRERQDVQEDAQGQQSEIGQRIFQKMGPVIMKYAQENGIGMIIDTSTPWPNGPVLLASQLDITKAVVDAYNAQSGVPAPAAGTGTTSKPLGTTRPMSPSTKPATPPAK
jgi:outer membrane protein